MEVTIFRQNRYVRLARTVFVLYVLALIWVLFLQRAGTALFSWDDYNTVMRLNLRPFATIDRYVLAIRAGQVLEIAYLNLLGNVVLFMPMGVLLPFGWKMFQRPWRFFLLMTMLLPAVEALQLILRCGCCDVDDVILNLFGAVLAYAIALPIAKKLFKSNGAISGSVTVEIEGTAQDG